MLSGLTNMLASLRRVLRKPEAFQGDEIGHIRLLAESVSDVIARLGPGQRIEYATPSCIELYGWTPEELRGRYVHEFIMPEDLPAIAAARERLVAGEVDRVTVVARSLRRDGSYFWGEGTARYVRNPVTGGMDEVLIIRDITERKKLEFELRRMALKDGLTGLANRRAFDEALEAQWQVTLAAGTQMSLLLLDVDYFKLFNDHYGHQVGDDCLRAVAAAVEAAIRDSDLAARYGGEEVAIILSDTDAGRAFEIAERVRKAVVALGIPHATRRDSDLVTVSVGAATAIARVGGTIRMPEGLLTAADTALYKAKNHGRNRVETALLVATASDLGKG